MAAGVTDRLWDTTDIVTVVEHREQAGLEWTMTMMA
jgi:hypothetical protein